MKIPVSVLVMTRNEEARIGRCLAALQDFSEIIVVDSDSMDETVALAQVAGATVISYQWNGQYPKKRQWCLDTLALKHDWIFFVDADEIVTAELVAEIASLFSPSPSPSRKGGSLPLPSGEGRGEGLPPAGYFIKGRYMMNGKVLRHGLCNNKLVLFDCRRVAFPVIDDLDLPGMGEIEGHYQPLPKQNELLSHLKTFLLHEAYDNNQNWEARHRRYAAWEAGMNRRAAWPQDPVPLRQMLKKIFRTMPGRGVIAFAHSYIFKSGFRDGRAGFCLARDRWRYYRMIAAIKPE